MCVLAACRVGITRMIGSLRGFVFLVPALMALGCVPAEQRNGLTDNLTDTWRDLNRLGIFQCSEEALTFELAFARATQLQRHMEIAPPTVVAHFEPRLIDVEVQGRCVARVIGDNEGVWDFSEPAIEYRYHRDLLARLRSGTPLPPEIAYPETRGRPFQERLAAAEEACANASDDAIARGLGWTRVLEWTQKERCTVRRIMQLGRSINVVGFRSFPSAVNIVVDSNELIGFMVNIGDPARRAEFRVSN